MGAWFWTQPQLGKMCIAGLTQVVGVDRRWPGPFSRSLSGGLGQSWTISETAGQTPHSHCMSAGWFVSVMAQVSVAVCSVFTVWKSNQKAPSLLSDLLTWLPLVLMDPGLFPSFSSLCQSTAGIKPNELSACTAAPVFVQRTNEQTAVAKTQFLHCCLIGQALGCGPALEFPGPLLLDILASCLNVGWGDLKAWEPSLQLQDQILVHQSPWAQIRDAQPCSLRTGMREGGSCADTACDL